MKGKRIPMQTSTLTSNTLQAISTSFGYIYITFKIKRYGTPSIG